MPELALEILRPLVLLAAAFLLALPVGWDREQHVRSMGLRTFPLVAMGSAGWAQIAQSVGAGDANAQARVIAGLVTGIGFLGGGAILKSEGRVRGTATAAAIWATALIGATVAFERYEIAIAVSVATFMTLRFLTPLKSRVDRHQEDAD